MASHLACVSTTLAAKFTNGVELCMDNVEEIIRTIYEADLSPYIVELGGTPYMTLMLNIHAVKTTLLLLEPDRTRRCALAEAFAPPLGVQYHTSAYLCVCSRIVSNTTSSM